MFDQFKSWIDRAMRNGQFTMHAGGFYLLNLDRDLELHMWPTGNVKAKIPNLIHDHSYSMKSLILTGNLLQEGYSEARENTSKDGRINVTPFEVVRSKRGNATIKQVGNPLELYLSLSANLSSGNQHYIRAGEIHRSTPNHREFTSTLVKKFGYGKNNSMIYLNGEGVSEKDLKGYSTNQKLARKHLDILLETVAEEVVDDALYFMSHKERSD